jgi:hypothetical protein
VAKGFTELGAPDPRLNIHGAIDKRLSTLYKGMKNQDPAATRVKPVPIQLLFHAQALATEAPTDEAISTIDMSWIGFFYILRPGEHSKTTDNKPLRGKNVSLKVGARVLRPFACPIADLDRVTESSLKFDDQKNRHKGEEVSHSISGHSIGCPTRATARRIKYIRLNGGDENTPLCAFKRGNRWLTVSSDMITAMLRTSVAMLPNLGLSPDDITARSLRAGGAMALLLGKVDVNVIKLVGRWRSDAVFEYLHPQIIPVTHQLARTMIRHGAFEIPEGELLPAHAQHIIDGVDALDAPGAQA